MGSYKEIDLKIIHLVFTICFSSALGIIGTSYALQFLHYKNDLNNFEIDYPSNWVYDDSTPGATFIPANESILGQGMENQSVFMIVGEDSSVIYKNIPLESYLSYVKARLEPTVLVLSNPSKIVIGGLPAYQIYGNVNATSRHTLLDITVKDGKPYTVIFGAIGDKFDQYLPTAQKMISTLIVK